jgi:hypothetical protein
MSLSSVGPPLTGLLGMGLSLNSYLSLPKIPSGLDSHDRAESSHR